GRPERVRDALRKDVVLGLAQDLFFGYSEEPRQCFVRENVSVLNVVCENVRRTAVENIVQQLATGAQLLLRPLALGDIQHGADHAYRLAGLVVNDVTAIQDPRIASVAAPEPIFVQPQPLTSIDGGVNARDNPLFIEGVNSVCP